MSTTPETPTPTNTSPDLMKELKIAWGVFMTKEQAMFTAAKTKEATLVGAALLCIPPLVKIMLAFLVLQSLGSPHYGGIFIHFVVSVVTLFAPFYIARAMYGGQGDIEEYFRVSSYARMPHMATVVLMLAPVFMVLGRFLDVLIDLWLLWVVHLILMRLMKLSETDAFKVVGITFIGYIVLMGFLQLLF